MLVVYSAAIFVSAALLFLVQPMAAKQVLPLLGGTPAVWTTSMLFFQASLLAGYAYSHLLTRLVKVKLQPVVHLAVIGAAVWVALPIGVPSWAPQPPDATGAGAQLTLVFYLIKLLGLSVGLPFFVLSTTGPLLQRWFSHTGHRTAADPYFLYAASNAGSFIGLLAYPFAIEPVIGLREQEGYWSWGFIAFGVLAVLCAVVLWARGSGGAAAQGAGASGPDTDGLSWGRRGRWVLLAAVPSSLLLGVTQHISTDVAAMPLLWVIPLALYLVTFVIVFSKRQVLGAGLLGYLAAAAGMGVCLAVGLYLRKPIMPLIVLHVGAFFVMALMCHKRLADDRPSPRHLTEYFLWMSVGGVVGGVFNALVAPMIFPEILEYPLAIVAACLLRPRAEIGGAGAAVIRWLGRPAAQAGAVVLVAGLVGAGLAYQRAYPATPEQQFTAGDAMRVVAPLAVALVMVTRIRVFAACLAVIFGVAKLVPDYARERFLFQERSFYSVHRVKETLDGRQRVLMHGTTWHGMQNRDAPGAGTLWEKVPTSYYHPSGPLGQMFVGLERDNRARLGRVGILGLGVGGLAAYALPGSKFTFYEIDDVVIRIAKDPTLFTFVSNAGDRVDTRLGDGRLKIAAEPDGTFDILILDAFSSDSVPAHLLTLEAVRTYVAKLKPAGILVFNVTNNHVDLRGVLRSNARELGLTAIIQDDQNVDEMTHRQGRLRSTWVLMSREDRNLRPMIDDIARWHRLEWKQGDPLWTDSYSSLVSVLKALHPESAR